MRPGAEKAGRSAPRVRSDLLWMIRVVGALTIVRRGGRLPRAFTTTEEGVAAATEADWLQLVMAVAEVVRGVRSEPRAMVYSVSLNREASPTVSRSTLAIKADAARRLFAISCRDLTWAVIDSGIDARHPGLSRPRSQDRQGRQRPAVRRREGRSPPTAPASSRRTTSRRSTSCSTRTPRSCPRSLKKRLQRQLPGGQAAQGSTWRSSTAALQRGRAIDWGLVAPFIRVPHVDGEVQAPRERSRHARGRDPGRRLAADGVGRAPRGRPDRRLPGPPPVRPPRARRGRAGATSSPSWPRSSSFAT